jgi:hypothetical protein
VKRWRRALIAIACLAVAGGAAGAGAFSAFTSAASNTGSSVTAAPDFRAPTVDAVIGKTAGGAADYLRPSNTYRVYANVTDTGNPASGLATLTADVSSLSAGQTAITFTAGTYTFDGVTYNRRSTNQYTAGASTGAKAWTVSASDNAGNSAVTNWSATVDNTAPAGAAVQATNTAPSGTPGRAETGDTLTLTSTEPLYPASILAGWTGASTNVTVRLDNNGGGDRVRIFNAGNTTQLNLGTVFLNRTDYTTANRRFTNSTMTMSGSTITIVLGTPNGAVTTAAGTGAMTWTPSATATDLAGNAMSTTTVTEAVPLDKEF